MHRKCERAAFSAAVVLLLPALQTPAFAQRPSGAPTARQIAAQAEAALVAITAYGSANQRLGHGSGFFIGSSGLIATNLHVIDRASNLQIVAANGDTLGSAVVLVTDRARDLAVLRVPSARAGLELGTDTGLAPGDRIYVMGNPLGFTATFSDGMVSGRREADGTAYIQFTAPISPGSSGGPLLDGTGRVVGIVTFLFREGQNLNLAVASRHLHPLLNSRVAVAPLTPQRLPEHDDIDSDPVQRALARQWVPVPAAEGTYTLSSAQNNGQRYRGGFVLFRARLGHRMLGFVARDPAELDPATGAEKYNWVDAPTTLTRAGAVGTVAGSEREGGFVSYDQIVLFPSTSAAPRDETWILTREEARLLSPTGLYEVVGAAGAVPWVGTVAIIDSGLSISRTGGSTAVAAALELRAQQGGQEHTFFARGVRAPDGTFELETQNIGGHSISAKGYLLGGRLELHVYRHVTTNLYHHVTVRGAKREPR